MAADRGVGEAEAANLRGIVEIAAVEDPGAFISFSLLSPARGTRSTL